ncbi:MAG: Holliday junction branch migration protein RuvA [Alphaproteobacteria bacterium]|nr:Holliday junction branch migration protein RuvA [Alphaproteobacteria bacterium]MBO7537328.1 Holliday junction branch migration protein RuvA [Alphaproteobacteria bacterium]MBO7641800.1 Holliday junction branch migration protein RuvA [Alphaproteobacteria bacterium]
MISYLKGSVEEVAENLIILDVNGVGYSLICSSRTISEAKEHGGVVKLHTVLNVREDAWTLFGFYSDKERFWFNKLNSVQGVGGKVAISILSALSEDDIYNAFLTEDKNMFTRADGVGAKLATRIISELKDKVVGKVDLNMTVGTQIPQSNTVNDVISALVNLGYQKPDILRTISTIEIDNDPQFDTLLRRILGKLSAGV